jgi:membrane-associated phospholipid phosphatase
MPTVRPVWLALFAVAVVVSFFVLDRPSVALFSALSASDDTYGTEVLGLRKGFVRLMAHRVTDAFTVPYLLVASGLAWTGACLARRLRLRAFVGAMLLAGLLQSAVTETIKLIVGRERPGDILEELGTWVDRWHPFGYGGSFPSGHATFGFALAAIGSAYWPRGRVGWYAIGVLVCLARLWLVRHNVSDVVVGAGLGWYIGAIVVLAYPPLSEEALRDLRAERVRAREQAATG